MKIVSAVNDLQALVAEQRQSGRTVAFVPTMGNLHDGHLSLVKKARELADVVVVSIYVNPMQFGANEDLESYPSTLAEDQAKLEGLAVDLLYLPTTNTIYPDGVENHTQVSVAALDGMHCGKSRPVHFTGVATVVTKLLNIVRPDVAVFGQKDFQQLAIIRKLVNDLCISVKVVGAATGRDERGLALSSRNGYLTPTELEVAPALYQTLCQARDAIVAGERNFELVQRDAFATLARAGFKPDYFNICHQQTLQPAKAEDSQLVILAAAYLGKARLIDNLTIEL